MSHPSFAAWLEAVDARVVFALSISLHDLDDKHPLDDWHRDGIPAVEAALTIVRASGAPRCAVRSASVRRRRPVRMRNPAATQLPLLGATAHGKEIRT